MELKIPRTTFPQLTDAIEILSNEDDNCLAYVLNEDGWLHMSFQLDGGIVVVDHIPEDHSKSLLIFYPDYDSWGQAMGRMQWIHDGLAEDGPDRWPALAKIEWDDKGWERDEWDDEGRDEEDDEDDDEEEDEEDEFLRELNRIGKKKRKRSRSKSAENKAIFDVSPEK